jgi:hypothetical protein
MFFIDNVVTTGVRNMGLHIDVFRASQGGSHIDCTMDGISSKADQLCIVNVPGPCNPSDAIPAAMLVKGNVPGTVKIVPAVKPGNEWIETRRNAVKPLKN